MGCNLNSSAEENYCDDIGGMQSAENPINIDSKNTIVFKCDAIFSIILSFSEMTIRPTFSNLEHPSDVLKVERPYYEQEQFNSELNYCRLDDSRHNNTICSRIRNVKPTHIFLSIFPLFSWLSQYSVKSDLLGDLVSGCTVAIMHIPQGK